MKSTHLSLSGLQQLAVAAFFAAAADARPYCADQHGQVVALSNCDTATTQATEKFVLTEHDGGDLQIGDSIIDDKAGGSPIVARDVEGPDPDLVSGGFGRRSPQRQCDPSVGHCVVGGVRIGSGSFGGGSNGG
ncbi:hypothetical protein GQ607_016593 [Colletotrichum asianum]|uniref:Uncharacterized protein n=1 Tax=Colletotrichum asianum TaxID=702518 RepID=A0A8H3VVJ0_9PEZI|nr:hypothetical protein GQ607_016593 [Colletotrichum asianum]